MTYTTKPRFTEYPIAASERPRYLYEYYVTGRGHFPYDMLRYDSCWPVSDEDAALIDQSERREFRSIKFRSYQEPTVARWSSFLWSVGTEKL